jgi:methylmalonyl-CoA epimerase
MTLKIDHIGIAVRDLDERLRFWRDALGLAVAGTEEVPTEGVVVAFLPAGESRVELLQASRADSPVAKFLDKRGEGIHHVTFQVDAIQPVLDRLRERGVPLLDDAPRPGATGSKVAFLDPRAAGGVLVELVEKAAAAPARGRGVAPGEPVLLYLRDPHERLWGILRDRDASGVTIEGFDLASFDAWMAQVERGEEGIVPSLLFVPMARVERILLDRGTPALPSLSDGFARRVGRTVVDVLGA